MKLHDISRPIHTGMPVWPGDTSADFKLVATIPRGSAVNIGRLLMSVHSGTHGDAPYHYNQVGARIDEVPIDTFVGPARVVDVRGHATITIALLSVQDFSATPRVLFKSDSWTDPAVFPTTWPLLAADVPAWLSARGVKLVGMDVPSVDHITSKDLPIHHALDAARIIILENLDLHAVSPGEYELIALPLKIKGGDGSPIRAVLRAVE
ncbi:MAG TPA: cyclase family protein [Lacunisphaera sp.]|nr:cyclase family protein [Lacunisphaera sp.]